METTDDQPAKITRQSLNTGFRVLWVYMSRYKRQILTLSVMGILSAVGNGVIPYIAGRFFDAILSSATIMVISYVLPVYLAVLILWSIIQLVTYLMDWQINIRSEYFSNAVWFDYLANGFSFILTLPVSFHKKHKIGEIGNKINMAPGSLETIVGRVVIDLAPQILSIVIAFAIAVYMKPILAIFLALGLVVYILVLVRKIRPLAGYQKDYYDILSNFFWGDAYDAIHNALAVKQATAEEHERLKLANNAKKALPLWMRMTSVWGTLTLYQRLIILFTQILIFILSVYYIRAGTMTLGELIAFNAYAAMIFGPFVTIARNWQTIQNGLVNLQETEKILQMAPENYAPDGAVPVDFTGAVEFRNASFWYEEGKHVLQNISFKVIAGDVIALVGESGVGKSTLIDLISGYNFPTSGEVLIDGHDVRYINLRELRRRIAVVPQEVVLFNDTIEANIKYGNFEALPEEVSEAARKAHALDFIEKFPDKWSQMVGERGIKLSVGQKQRIAIARAILRNPRILILDEPTSALDAGSEQIITRSLDELMQGKTTFIIAHRLSTVRKADKILVFKDGRIMESGTHTELLKIDGGEYRRLYELQIGLHG